MIFQWVHWTLETKRNGTSWNEMKQNKEEEEDEGKKTQSSIGSVTTGDRSIDGQSRLHANRRRRHHLALLHFLSLLSPFPHFDVVIVNLIIQCESKKKRYYIYCTCEWVCVFACVCECVFGHVVSIQLVMASIYWFQLHTSGSNCVQWTHIWDYDSGISALPYTIQYKFIYLFIYMCVCMQVLLFHCHFFFNIFPLFNKNILVFVFWMFFFQKHKFHAEFI